MRDLFVSLLVVLGTGVGSAILLPQFSSPPGSADLVAQKPQPQDTLRSPTVSSSLPYPATPAYIRPLKADNGSPFPKQSGYVANYPQKYTDGYSSVTVDNSKNDSDVFVKLFSVNDRSKVATSVFFIRAHESFTVKEVRAGQYDVRYRDLDSGRLTRTDPFTLKEVEVANGVEFSKMTLTLYKVANGNMKTHDISEAEF